MQDLIDSPEDEGCYIVDRRMQSVEDTANNLTNFMFQFCNKTRRQRINQRNRVERLSPLLDWKNLGIEYTKSRQLALRRAYPDAFLNTNGEVDDEDADWFGASMERFLPMSGPASPRLRMSGLATPGDMGTLTEKVSCPGWRARERPSPSHGFLDGAIEYERLPWVQLATADRGRGRWVSFVSGCSYQDVVSYWFISALCVTACDSPLVMKVRSRAGSVHSGVSTPGGGAFKSLSEGDLQKADAALSQVNTATT